MYNAIKMNGWLSSKITERLKLAELITSSDDLDSNMAIKRMEKLNDIDLEISRHICYTAKRIKHHV